MKKRLLLLASAALFSTAAFAQAVIADSTAVGLVGSTTSAALEAGALIGSNDAFTLSIGTPDTYKKSSTYVSPYTSIVINGEEISTGYGIQGSNDAKNAAGKKPAALYVPTTGTSYKLDAKKDGYAVVWSKLNTDKKFVVFEEETAIGYSLTMQVDSTKIEYTLEGSGDNNALTSSVSKISALSGYSGSAANGLGVLVFPISANKSYIIAGDGTKMIIGGVSYSADDNISVVLKGKDVETTLLEAEVASNVLEYTISPAANANGTVASITPIVVTFPNATKIEKNASSSNNSSWDDEDEDDDDEGGSSVWDAPAKAPAAITPATEDDLDEGESVYRKTSYGWFTNSLDIEIGENTITYNITSKVVDGQYALYIPAGTYLIDGTPNETILVNYYYEVPVYASVSPKAGSVDSLQTFVITVNDATEVTANFDRDNSATLYSSATKSTTYFTNFSTEGNTLTLSLNAPIFYKGTYTLTVPGAGYKADGEAGQDLSYTFKIVASSKTTEYTVTPAADENGNVSTISPIVVTFPNVLSIEKDDLMDYDPTIKCDGESVEFTTEINGNTIYFYIAESDIQEGTYTLSIPSWTYDLDGSSSPKVSATFNYVAPVQDYAVVLPAEGEVEGLQSFTIEFPNATAVATTFSREACPTLYSVAGGYNVATFTSGTVDGNKLTLSINSAITTLGEYELRIPGASYLLDSVAGQDLTYKYTIVASAKTQEYAIDSAVTTLSPIVLTFPNVETIANATEDDLKDVLELEHVGLRGTVADVISEVQISGNQLLIFVQDADDAIDGTYTLHLYDGILLLDGVENDEITATFTYTKPVQDYAVVLPGEGEVEGLQSFTIEFPNATAVATTFSREACPTLYSVAGGYNVATFTSGTVDGNKLTLSINSAITTLGEYELRIPGASYTVDGETGQDLTYKYTIVASDKTQEFAIDSAVTTLSPIVISFPNVDKLESNVGDELADATGLYRVDPYRGEIFVVHTAEISGKDLLLFVEDADNAPEGQYRISFDAGILLLDGVENEALTADFTYTKPVVNTLEYTIIPEADADGKVSSISPIVITFPNATTVDTTDVALDITVTYPGRFYGDAEAIYTLSVQDRSVYITLDDADIQSTTYTLTIPAGAFLVDGVENEEIVKTFIYEVKVPAFTLNVTPDSETKVASVESIIIAVEGEEVESVSFDLSSAYFYALDAENDNLIFADTVMVEDNKLVILFNTPITTSGTYTVYISANVITINGVQIQEMQTITFTVDSSVTGINGIVNNAAVKGAIYNLRGVKVDRNNLVPGIYVIDGKKVQLR